MKKITLFLSALAVMAGFATLNSCQTAAPAEESTNEETTQTVAQKGAIVYFNLDRVLNEYDMANDLGSVLQSKLQSIDQEVTRRGNKLQSDLNAFNEKIEKGLLTRSTAEAQNEKLVKQQNDFQTYYNQKQQEMQEEQAVTMNQIANAIKEYIDKFNAEKQFALIIATQGDILPQPVVAGDPDLDITDMLIEGLNAEYVKTRNENN
ncbi:MAG: OmpH family outer membrane protein [Bacteroidales bacterium]|jgi:Outer membrane protein|nr:OmpH family outer membrane protein [Bacteroidales bacterium]